MGFIYFILIGIAAGWLAGKFMKGSGFGVLGNLIIGVIGAIIGGFVFGILGFDANSLLGSLITATVGAMLLLYLIPMVAKKKK